MKSIKTVCPRDCYDSCLVTVDVDGDGRIKSVRGDRDNPFTRGFTCPRGKSDALRVYTNRVLHPYIRTGRKPGKNFKRSSWEEALDLISGRLSSTIEKHGGESILLLDYAGFTGLLSSRYAHRIWNALGATRTDEALCSSSGHAGIELHYGESYGLQPDELERSDLFVFWGFNAPVSSPHLWSLAVRSRKENGSGIIAIDPRISECCRGSDITAHPKPGSDVALAMGICRYLIENNGIDHEFIENETQGFEFLRNEALGWSPGRVREETGLEWEVIARIGSAYLSSKKSATLIGIGLQKNAGGADMVRAVSFIPALRGLRRGFFYTNGRAYLVDTDYLTGESFCDKPRRIASQVALGSSIRNGDFKFLFVYSMNPALTLPNQAGVREGLSREDVFNAVHETHWTATTDYADVVFPATTFLEKRDIVIPWTHRYIRLAEKAIEPLGESRDETWLMVRLVEKLGLREQWLREDPWQALERAFEGSLETGTFRDLMDGKTLTLRPKPRGMYSTPSGKLEFKSSRAESSGLQPFPEHRPPDKGPGEFILLNSATRNYTNTQFTEVHGPVPRTVLMNPAYAARMKITCGMEVELENDLGRIILRVRPSESVPAGVLWSPRQLTDRRGTPMNHITPDILQAIGGGPTFNSTVVRVRRASTIPYGSTV